MSTENKNVRFYQLLEVRLLSEFRKTFTHCSLDQETMTAAKKLFDVIISGIFNQSNYHVSTKAISWLSDQYLKSIRIDDKSLNMVYPTSGVQLSELSFSEIELFRNLFEATTMKTELQDEFNKRNLS